MDLRNHAPYGAGSASGSALVPFEAGAIRASRQFTHGAWSDLKADNDKHRIPLPQSLHDRLKARHASLDGDVVRRNARPDERLVFPAPDGKPIDYSNWRSRVWLKLLKKTGPTPEHPRCVAVAGTFHMLRHGYATR